VTAPIPELADQILSRCNRLGGLSEAPDCLTRTFLRPSMGEAHQCLTEWMRAAGLTVRLDALGNLIGRRPGREAGARVFVIGSHIDTVPNAGRFDGVLGVLLGIAAMHALKGRDFNCAVDIIAFSEEEGVRFTTPLLGSRAICGCFDLDLLQMLDGDGVSMAQAVRDFGLNPAEIAAAAYPDGAVTGYLEPHIEQGPVLESLDAPVGIVDAIVGQSRRWLLFAGKAGHAGTQPMETRRDALAAAAEFVVGVEQTAKATPGLRATVGSLVVEPGAINVIPGAVKLSLDVRHGDDGVRCRALAGMIDRANGIAAERGLGLRVEPILEQPAVPTDPGLTSRLALAVEQSGQAVRRLVSGAGHDAMVMAQVCPMTMLFIRSLGGISHHPSEAVRRDDVAVALEVIIRFLESELELDT
jgi:allantoate deiminase